MIPCVEMSLANNNRRVRPVIILATDKTNETEENGDFINENFEASKISLIRLEQADHVDRLLECIRDNDGQGADELLGDLSLNERRELLSQPILSQTYRERPSKHNFYRRMDYTWLSLIVAGAGSDQVFQVIVKYGAPLDVSEADGSTIGHAVVYGAYFMPELEESFVSIYFHFAAQIGNRDKLKQCMLAEDMTGARPLELAAVLGKFEIFHAMMETENLYKSVNIRQGTWNRATYNFLEYEKAEPGGRRGKSPLKIFCFLREKDLDSPGFRRVFASPPVQMWMSQHVNTTRFALFAWCMIRTIFTAVYMSVLARVEGVPFVRTTTNDQKEQVNITTCPAAYAIVIPDTPQNTVVHLESMFLSICLTSFFIFDICDALYYFFHTRKNLAFFERPGAKSESYIVHTLDHRILQVLFILNVLATIIFRQLELEAVIYSYVFSILFVSLTYSYFLQFLPGIGYLVIGLQRSLNMFGSFFIIFFIIFISFSLAFYVLSCICCLQYSVAQSIYQTFQIFLNQVNILTDFECEWYRREAWTVIHILFIMFIVILLLNFCIAILSESAIRITNFKDILQNLQYLNASMVIEDRIGWAARPLRKYFHKGFQMGLVKASVKLRQPFAMK